MATSIEVVGLSKVFRLGEKAERYKTLRDAIMDTAFAPAKKLKRLLSGKAATHREEHWALRDVSFSVEQGEAIGIVGRNGAGKSTLLKVLSRITEPSGGHADLHGRVASLLEVGTGFHPELSGRENIFLNAAILGMKRHEIVRQFDEIVAFAEVEKFVDTPVKHYSSGMYLRLAFAVAAHLSPEILLIDEVLAVGDATFQKKCLGKMEDVTQQGRTVLFVSHNMAAVQRLCKRAVFLQGGTVERVGPVGEVIGEYLTAGTDGSGERTWTSGKIPGNEVVRLRAVRALDATTGQPSGQFAVTSAFDLEIEFEVLEAGRSLTAAFHVYDGQGTLLCVVGDFQDPARADRPREKGVYKERCRFPAHLLNEGTLAIMAAVVTMPFTVHVIEREALAIRINDDMAPIGARGSYTREWPGGVFRPKLDWSFEHTPTKS